MTVGAGRGDRPLHAANATIDRERPGRRDDHSNASCLDRSQSLDSDDCQVNIRALPNLILHLRAQSSTRPIPAADLQQRKPCPGADPVASPGQNSGFETTMVLRRTEW